MLQCVAICCSVLQSLQCAAERTAVCCSALQCCSALLCVVVLCSMLQCAAKCSCSSNAPVEKNEHTPTPVNECACVFIS